MLVIQPTADGRYHVSNNHRSGYARDTASARMLAHDWGHTDLSVNKALSEMRSGAPGAPPSGWRVARPEREAPPRENARVEVANPVAERSAEAPPRRRAHRAQADAAAPPAAPDPERLAAAPAKKPARSPSPAPAAAPPAKPRKRAATAGAGPAAEVETKPAPRPRAKPASKSEAKAAAKSAPKPPEPKRAPRAKAAASREPAPAADPREQALALFRAGAKELARVERGTLPFARGPWSELRRMAEHIATCLEGKKPKDGPAE